MISRPSQPKAVTFFGAAQVRRLLYISDHNAGEFTRPRGHDAVRMYTGSLNKKK